MRKLLVIVLSMIVLLWTIVAFAGDNDPVLEPISPDQFDEVAAGETGDLATYNATGPKVEWKTVAELNLLTTSSELDALGNVAAMTEATGDLFYYSGSAWDRLAAGTQGYALQMGASLPAWAQLGLDDIAGGAAGANAFDFGAATSLEIPNSATPTVDAVGEIALDTTITGHQPLLVYESTGSQDMTIIAIPTSNLVTTDNYIIKYDSANSEFTMEEDQGGSPGSFGTWTDGTLSTGVLNATGGANFWQVAGEGAAADDLTEIQAAAVGDVLIITRDQGAAYTVTVKHNNSYLKLADGVDFSLNHDNDTITLICESAGATDIFREIGRISGG